VGKLLYTQENAITFAGGENGRAAYIRRTGRLIDGMGPVLAPTHLATDAGIVYPMATYPQKDLTPAEIQQVADVAGRLLWSGTSDHYNFELVDSDHTPLDNFERYRALMLPNPQAKDDPAKYPHLAEYSEKAQRMLVEYVNDGGTLIVLPSAPGGAILRELLKPLGPEEFIPGTSTLRFANGSTAAAIGGVYAVTPDEKSGVTVFARNAGDRIVGARFQHGKGRILFFGADLSRWVFPPDTHLMEGGVVAGKTPDFPENRQYSARHLPALMNAPVSINCFGRSHWASPGARCWDICGTVSDRGSHRFRR
jgi:hypothetical protein